MSEGELKKRIIRWSNTPFDKWHPTETLQEILAEAKKGAPTPEKIIAITKERLGRIPDGGLGKAVLDCIESAEWREWFERWFGEAETK